MATRWGIVSAAKISHDFVTVLRSLPKDEHQIVSVAARSLQRAQEFASRHQIPKAYGSYEELANDPNVDIAYVGVINTHHYPVGKMMLNAGKNTLIEKPMGMNKKEVQELIDLAKKKNVFLMEGIWSRFFPAYDFLEKELQKKTIGDIVLVSGNHGFEGKNAERVQKLELGGGALFDIGIYMLNGLTTIFKGKPEQMVAVSHLNETGADTTLSASFKFKNGAIGSFALSTVADFPCEITITGTKGQIKILKPYHCPTEIITPEKTHKFPLPEPILPLNFINSSGLRYEAMAVRECLQKGLKECPKLPLKDTLLISEMLGELAQQVGVKYS